MSHRFLVLFLCVFVVAGCQSSNPFDAVEENTETETTLDTTETGDGIDGERELPPGTPEPSAQTGIVRFEPDGDGSGDVTSMRYDSATDTFIVDNLPFDGNSPANEDVSSYTRDDVVGQLGGYAIYENVIVVQDPQSDADIRQSNNKAIYGISQSGQLEFAIVRTGSYTDYGFGGYIYQRSATDKTGEAVALVLPTSGQAIYTGKVTGLRDNSEVAQLEYSTGDLTVAIDFDDPGVRGSVTNRKIFDLDGREVTAAYIDAINSRFNASLTEIPDMTLAVSADSLDKNGEISTTISSQYLTASGIRQLDQGHFYAIIGGKNADEMVGVIVVESEDPVTSGSTTRDTGGFIIYR